MSYNALVIGVSAGGFHALQKILPKIPVSFPPILIVQHIHRHMDDAQIERLQKSSALEVRFAEDKDLPKKGMALFAPANYHMLVETNHTISLNTGPPVNHARPSIDPLFETAAEAFGRSLIGLILTGASSDGSKGLRRVSELGGLTIVQNPETAEMSMMPKSAIAATDVDLIANLEDLPGLLVRQITPSNPVNLENP